MNRNDSIIATLEKLTETKYNKFWCNLKTKDLQDLRMINFVNICCTIPPNMIGSH